MSKKILGFFVLVATLVSASQAAGIAVVNEYRGQLSCLRSSGDTWFSVQERIVLDSGDMLRTGPGSSASIRFFSGHEATLAENSEIKVKEDSREKTEIDVLIGNLRSRVRSVDREWAYKVITPQAVCAVRGTDFEVTVQDEVSIVRVFSGLVEAMEIETGSSVNIGPGQSSSIRRGAAPSDPAGTDTGAIESGRESTLSEEIRREMFREISRDAVMNRAVEDVKRAEYENGKALIDVRGRRVRLEEYIVRPNPNQFKYVVLNKRKERFDFSKMLFAFNKSLPADLNLATRTMFRSEEQAKPEWILTDMLSVVSNTQDQINEEAYGGDMIRDSNNNWRHYFSNYEYSIKGGDRTYADIPNVSSREKGKILWTQVVPANVLNTAASYSDIQDGVVTTYIGDVVPISETSQPSGSDNFHFYEIKTYGDNTWVARHDYLIDDSGAIKTSGELEHEFQTGLSGNSFRDYLSELNFQSIYSSSEFDGRDIDIVFSTKILLDSGIIGVAYGDDY